MNVNGKVDLNKCKQKEILNCKTSSSTTYVMFSTEIIDNPLKFCCGIWVQRGWQQNTNKNEYYDNMIYITANIKKMANPKPVKA